MRYKLYPPGTRKGNTTFVVRFTYTRKGENKGRRVERSLDAVSLAQARIEVLRKRDELEESEALESEPTFAMAAVDYLSDLPEGAGHNERKYLAPILLHVGSDRLLKDITPQYINDVAHALKPRVQEQTRHRCVKTPMRAVVAYHERGGRRNPVPDNQRVDWITPEQFEELIECVEASRNPVHMRRLIFALVGSGIRSEDAVQLQMSNINPRAAQIWIADPKNNDARWAFIETARSLPELMRHAPTEGAVFRRKGGKPFHVNPSRSGGQFADDFNPIRDAAGLPWITIHTFRHTFATWFWAVNKDLNALMAYGGWKSVAMAMRYTKLAPADLPERLAEHGWNFKIGGQSGLELEQKRFNVV